MAKIKIKRESLIPKTVKKNLLFKDDGNYCDYSLLAAIILLTCFGLIMLYSTSSYMAQAEFGDDMHFFKRQGWISLGSIIGALIISRFDYHILASKNILAAIYGVAVFLMLLVKTPLGVTINGARRWLKIGVQFQPAEIAKIAAILCLAYGIVKLGRRIQTLKSCMRLAGLGAMLAFIAYKFTDNLSTAIIIFGITAGMIFLAHPKTKLFVKLALGGIVLLGLAILVVYNMPISKNSFRIRRVQVWLRPEQFAAKEGYQTMQSLYAIASGGWFGRGFGNSIQKLGSVPEAENDMIFSIICEELGIFGGLMVMLLFAYLLYRLFFIAQNAPDLFGTLIVSGVFIHMALQVVFNIAVVVNAMPNTGVTLPFISYGGTSIMFLMAEMGMALSVSRKIQLKKQLL